MLKKVSFTVLCPLILLGLSLLPMSVRANAVAEIQSPNKKLTATFNVANMTYTVLYNGKEVVAPSKLGLRFKDEAPFGAFKLADQKTQSVNNTWTYPWGRQKQYIDRCSEATLVLEETGVPNRSLSIVFRVYDDGVAFRYLINEKTLVKKEKEYVLENDLSEFNFSGNPTAWFTSYKGYVTSQEEFFPKQTLRDMKPDMVIGCPVVVQTSTDGPYVALTEADVKTWGGLFFKNGAPNSNSDAKVSKVVASVAPRNDKNGLAKSTTPDASPWRVLIVGEKAIDLVDQTIVMNVSTPIDPKADFSWVVPGSASWDWWSASNVVMNTETIKGFIDQAAEMGWRYTFVDDPWYAGDTKKMGDTSNNVLKAYEKIDMDEVLRSSKVLKVKLFLWLNWKDIDRQLDDAFALYEKWGIAGVKIDFMDREDQEMIEWYDKITKKAAEHKLLVDFHGAFKPNGYRRAHPNLITREGIRGNEYNKWSKLTPEHYCTIPYTRLMLGPGDFTPGAFLNRYYDGPLVEGYKTAQGIGTRAHELAISLIYDSPILCLCDCAEVYKENGEDQPGLDFYRNLPTVWDESRGVAGEIGQYFSLLRRKGNDWYYGAITDKNSRTLALPLDFLGRGRYEATIYADTPETETDARKISVETKIVTASDTLEIRMGREGGQAITFKPLDGQRETNQRQRFQRNPNRPRLFQR